MLQKIHVDKDRAAASLAGFKGISVNVKRENI